MGNLESKTSVGTQTPPIWSSFERQELVIILARMKHQEHNNVALLRLNTKSVDQLIAEIHETIRQPPVVGESVLV